MEYKLKDDKLEDFIEDNLKWLRKTFLEERGDLKNHLILRLELLKTNHFFDSVEELNIEMQLETNHSYETHIVSKIMLDLFWKMEKENLNEVLDIDIDEINNWKSIYKSWILLGDEVNDMVNELIENENHPSKKDIKEGNFRSNPDLKREWTDFVKTITRNNLLPVSREIEQIIMDSKAIVYDELFGTMIAWGKGGFKAFSPFDNQIFLKWFYGKKIDKEKAYEIMKKELMRKIPKYIEGDK